MGLSPTPIAHVSASPPLIPDGRISPAKAGLAAMAFPSRTFPFKPKLKCLPTCAPCLNGLISNLTFLFCFHYSPAQCLASVSFKCPPFTESPFARSRCYLLRCRIYARHQRALPLLHSSYWLMRQTCPPSRAQARRAGHNPLTASNLTLHSKSLQVVERKREKTGPKTRKRGQPLT